MSAIVGHGLRVDLPATWEGRLLRRAGRPGPGDHPAAYGDAEESVNPVLHLGNFPLPPGRGDFGTGAVERMGSRHVFVALVEFDRVEADRPLFADHGVPRPVVADFGPRSLQRHIPGQLGCQRFFTENGRPFCLYVVLGSRRHAEGLVAQAATVLAGLEVAAA